jgi:phage terminase large subunit-like protein
VTRHPQRKAEIAVRYCGIWQPAKGELLDFEPIENELRRLCSEFSILEVAYDPHQLHDMAMRLNKLQFALFKEFKQGEDRLKADKGLQDLIINRHISHDRNPLLRQHIDNSNAKTEPGEKKGIRLVKRSEKHKIDAAVALSMATARCLYYNLG